MNLKGYFLNRQQIKENRAVFRLKQKAQQKIAAIKARLLKEKNKNLGKLFKANEIIKK